MVNRFCFKKPGSACCYIGALFEKDLNVNKSASFHD